MNHFSGLLLFAVIFINAFSAFAGPGKTTYQAKIVKPDGYPLEVSSVNFKFTILDPAGSCVLYSETYSSVNMSGTGGLISFALGSGVKTYPASATTFEQVFSNITPSLSCDTGGPANYAPAASDIRKIVMQFHDGSGWQTLPAMSINAVPYAMYANEATKLNGLTSSDFVQLSTVPTCAVSEVLRYTGAGFSCVALGGGVTSSTVVTALGYTPADSVSLTTVTSNVSSVSSTVFSVSSTVTSLQNSVAASFAAITSSQWTTSGTSINYIAGYVGIGTTTPVTKLDVSGGVRIGLESTTCAPALAGTLRYNASNVEYCNGTSWQAFGVSGSGITNINGSTSGTQSLATGTGGTAPNFNTSNGVHTLNIPLANTGSVTAGLLSNADYTTFSNKITSSAASIAQVLGYVPADNAASGTYAQKANNLSDLTNIATARTNLGLGTFATANTLDLGSASATGTLAVARLPSFTGDATIAAASNTIILSNSGVTAGTYTKVTVDSKGRVTSSAALASSDVTTALGYTPANSATTVSSQWATSGTTINYMTGNVGIGTSSPSAKFEVSGTSNFLDNVTITAGRKLGIGVSPGSYSLKTDIGEFTTSVYTSQVLSLSGGLNFGSSGTGNKMVLDAIGNVGIGTTTPVTKLDVSGGVRIGLESTTCTPALAGTLRYNASNVEYCNGTSWQAFGVSGSGITNINGSTSGTQSLATGTGGTAPNFNTSNGVHTLNIPLANTGSVTAGLLSNADYTTFSNKITSSAASIAQVLGYVPADNAASGTYAQKANNLSDLTNIATARTNLGLGTFATANTLDLGSASATGTLAIARLPSFTGDATIAAASNTIILSNSGVTAGTYTKVTVDSKGRVTSGTQITSSDVTTALGYTPANSATIVSSQWTTSGTTINYMTGNVGIGTTSPGTKLDINNGTLRLSSSNAAYYTDFINAVDSNNAFRIQHHGADILHTTGDGYTAITLGNNGAKLQVSPANGSSSFTGNVGIGTTTPSAKLHVYGTNLTGSTSSVVNITADSFDNLGSDPTLLNLYTPFGAVPRGKIFKAGNPNFNFEINNNGGVFNKIYAGGYTPFLGGGGTEQAMQAIGIENATWFDGNTPVVAKSINLNITGWSGSTPSYRHVYGVPVKIRASNSGATSTAFYADVADAGTNWAFYGASGNIYSAGNVGIGITTPTARLHLAAGTSTLAPLKFTSGTLLSSPQSGTMEYDGFNFYITDSANTRRTIATGSSAGTIDNVSSINSSGNITMTPVGSVIVSSTTTSTNSSTGALVVKGGLGVAENLNVAGTISGSAKVLATGFRANQGSPDNNDSSTNGYAFGVDGDTGMFSPGTGAANGVLAFFGNNAEVMRLTNGKVGIGTSSPTQLLEVRKDQAGAATIAKVTNANNTSGSQARFDLATVSPNAYSIMSVTENGGGTASFEIATGDGINNGMYFTAGTTVTSQPIVFRQSTTERMRISSTGNIGIGIASPQAKLDVSGNIATTTGVFYNSTSGNTAQTILSSDATAGTATANVAVWGASHATYAGDVHITNRTSGATRFYNYNGSTWTETVRITSGGNMGIGTTNPSYPLDVKNQMRVGAQGGSDVTLIAGGSGYGSQIYQYYADGVLKNVFSANGNSYMTAGSVGIGTSAPANVLHVKAPSSYTTQTSQFAIGDSTSDMKLNVGVGTDGTNKVAWVQATEVNISNDRNLALQSFGGKVGIGTTNPAAQLHVGKQEATAGTLGSVDRMILQPYGHTGGPWVFRARDTASDAFMDIKYGSGNIITLEDGGNVGVGTLSPSSKLDVKGALSAGDAYAGNSEVSLTPLIHAYIGGSGDIGSGSTAYILVAYNQSAASGISSSGFDGQIYSYRGSTGTWNNASMYDVAIKTAYDAPKVHRFNTYGPLSGAHVVSLTYNGTSYIAVRAPAASAMDYYISGRSWAFKPILIDSVNHGAQISAVTVLKSPYINSSETGYIGIGTNTPLAPIHAYGGTAMTAGYNRTLTVHANHPSIQFKGISDSNHSGGILYDAQTSSEGMRFIVGATSDDVYGTGVNVMSLQANGNVGIGTSAPGARFHIADYTTAGGKNLLLGDDSFLTDVDVSNTLGIYGNQDSTQGHIRLGSSGPLISGYLGFVGIGNATPAYTLDVSGDLRITGTPYRNGGDIAWTVPSDARLKDVIRTYDRGLREIANLDMIIFKYKKDNPKQVNSDKEYTGVIAQQVQEQIPEAVSVDKDGFLSLNTTPIFWAMINAIKELYNEVTGVSREVAAVKAENAELKKQNSEIKAYLCAKDRSAPICK